MAGYKVSQYAMADAQFILSHERRDAITILGLPYASRWKVQRVFAADFDRSIFSVPLAERRRRLLAIDWVEDASVSRVWPDRLVVRIRERRPVAFVSFRSGPLLIDAQGVLLEQPPQARFPFRCSPECAKGKPKPTASTGSHYPAAPGRDGVPGQGNFRTQCVGSGQYPHRFPGGWPRGDTAAGRRQLRAALPEFSQSLCGDPQRLARRRCSICAWTASRRIRGKD